MLASTLRRTALSRLSGTGTIHTTPTRSFVVRSLSAKHSSCFSTFTSSSASPNSSTSSQQEQPPFIEGLRQKNIPNPGTNEDADSAISGFVNMFNDKESKTVSISACTKHGFVTTEAITLQGPVLCIGGQVFLWDIFKDSGAVQQSLKRGTTAPSADVPARSIFETMDEGTAREIFKVFEMMDPRPGRNTERCSYRRMS